MNFLQKAMQAILKPDAPIKVTSMAPEDAPDVTRSDLTQEDRDWLDHLRASVDDSTGFATDEAMPVDRRLDLIQTQIDSVPPGDLPDPQSIGLGAILGNMLARDLGLSWIVYEDENGRDLALGHADHSVTLFPLSMILKRQVDRVELDVAEMFRVVALASAEQIKDELGR